MLISNPLTGPAASHAVGGGWGTVERRAATSGRCVDGRVGVIRTAAKRAPLIRRLGRIEGQVRGLWVLIEAGRHCLHERQQIWVATVALRVVGLFIIGQPVTGACAWWCASGTACR